MFGDFVEDCGAVIKGTTLDMYLTCCYCKRQIENKKYTSQPEDDF